MYNPVPYTNAYTQLLRPRQLTRSSKLNSTSMSPTFRPFNVIDVCACCHPGCRDLYIERPYSMWVGRLYCLLSFPCVWLLSQSYVCTIACLLKNPIILVRSQTFQLLFFNFLFLSFVGNLLKTLLSFFNISIISFKLGHWCL